jgi:hypothetical protein
MGRAEFGPNRQKAPEIAAIFGPLQSSFGVKAASG